MAEIRPAHGPSWYRHFRRRRLNPAQKRLAFALILSTLLHLSLVTLFRVVAYLPAPSWSYYAFELVPLETKGTVPAASVLDGDVNPGTERFTPHASEGEPLGPIVLHDPLAVLEPPTLEYGELRRLQLLQESEADGHQAWSPLRTEDSWAQFVRTLQGFGRSLSRLALKGLGGESLSPTEATPPEPVVSFRVAEGYMCTLRWDSEPRDRKPLFAPPIPALSLAQEALPVPMEFVLTVNGLGRVINVWTLESGPLIEDIQAALLQYRFEPLGQAQDREQMGTLRIVAEKSGHD